MEGQNNKLSLSYIDLFGVQPKFYINNKEKYRTSWGGILTFSLFVCVVIACWIYGKDMYFRESPSTTISEIPTSHPERFNVTKETFNFSFGLQGYDKQNYFDETIYTVKFYQFMVNKIPNGDGTTKNEFIWRDLEPRRCTEDDFLLDKEYFVTNEANFNMYCINYDLEDIFIEGIWGADRFSSVVGKVYPCQNSTDSDIICQSQEAIEEKLTDNQYAINFSDQVIDPKNYQEPFTYVGRNSFGLASWDTYRVNNFYYSNVFLEDNVGIIFDDMEQKRGLQYENDKELMSPNQHKDKVFLEFYLRFQSAKQKKIYRTYLNLAQVMANVGGILKVLMIGGAFISLLVSKQLFNLQLANQIFAFHTEYNDEDDQNKTKNQNKNKKNSGKNSHNYQDQQKEDKDHKIKHLQFKSYLGLIFPFCASKKTKKNKEYLNFAVQKLTQRLNMNYLLEKFVEIEKIKLLLLDNDQYKLFEYISKPTIDDNLIQQSKERKEYELKQKSEGKLNYNDQENIQQSTRIIQNLMLQENVSQEQKKINCMNAYKQICQKKYKNDFDYKILNFIDEDIIKEVEEQTGFSVQNVLKQTTNLNTSYNINQHNLSLSNQKDMQLSTNSQQKHYSFQANTMSQTYQGSKVFSTNKISNSKQQLQQQKKQKKSSQAQNCEEISEQQYTKYTDNQTRKTTQANQNLRSSQFQESDDVSQDQSHYNLNDPHNEIDTNHALDNMGTHVQIIEQNDDKPAIIVDKMEDLDVPLSQEFPEIVQQVDIQSIPESNNSQIHTFKDHHYYTKSGNMISQGLEQTNSPQNKFK